MNKNNAIASTLLASLAVLWAAQASAQPPAQDFPTSTEAPAGMLTIDSENDVPGFSVQELVYAKRDALELKLKLVNPNAAPGAGGPPAPGAAPAGPGKPVIVYVQGSAWFPFDNLGTLNRAIDLAEHTGFVVASLQYRYSSIAKAPAQIQDVKSAIRYLRANAQRLRLNPDKIGILGDSSGGHLAVLTGTSDGVKEFVTDDNAGLSSGVQAVVDFFGPTDFKQMSKFPSSFKHDDANSPESTLIGGPIQAPENAAKVEAYNPIHYVSKDKKLPPFLIMHGDKDALVPFNQSVLLYQALKDANQPVTFYKVKGAGHEIRFWTPAVMDIVYKFFTRELKN
ncbi:MAG TPA: alpha/beta hydrolase [Candidatus Acidoferrum sp.]|nr:alpha/beta hydrolase [Candidatus Acidoferrum sp.]